LTPAPVEAQTAPLPGTLAHEDVVRRQLAGEEISRAANDRRAGVSDSMAAMPETPAAIPPEVAEYARQRQSRPGGIQDVERLPTAAPGTAYAPPAKEQFELEAEEGAERERERVLERSRNIRGFSEGLDLLGRSLGGLKGGRAVQEPMGGTPGLDEQITRQEDYVPLATRRMLEAKGIKVPEGARLSDLEKILPAVTRLTEGELDRQSAQRVAQTKAIASMQPDEMSDKELADLQQIDDAIRSIRQLGKEREEKGYYTGPLDKMGAKIGEWSGMISPESSEWRRKVQTQLATYIHAMAGGALTPTEVEMYIGAIPHTGLQEEQFDAQVEGILGQLEDKRANMLRTRRFGGKKTKPFEKTTVQVGSDSYAVPIGELREFVNAQR